MKKNKGWHRARHDFYFRLIRPFFKLYIKSKYDFQSDKLDNKKRPYLIIFNHQTAHDQFFMYYMCKHTVYFVASDDLLTMGGFSKFLTHVCGIIPIKKNTTDAAAVKICYKVAREGYSMVLAPEGNRTYTGETVHISPAISKFIKLLKLPVAVVKIDGGYGAAPRWAEKTRRGKVQMRVEKIIEPEQFMNMQNDELYEVVKNALYSDESDDGRIYRDIERSAEYLERALYTCPSCKKTGSMRSEGREFFCTNCDLKTLYHPDKRFDEGFIFHTPLKWQKWQDDWVRQTDIEKPDEIATDNNVRVDLSVKPKKKNIFKSCTVSLFPAKMRINGEDYPFDRIVALTVCGRNKLYLYLKDKTLQLKGDKRFSALKYVNYFHNYKNIKEGKPDEFLGL